MTTIDRGTRLKTNRCSIVAGVGLMALKQSGLLELLLVLGVCTHSAVAALSQTEGTQTPICGQVMGFNGEAQILDVTRTRLTEVLLGAPVHCGSFVSTPKGWLKIRHRDGVVITFGQAAFIQFSLPNSEGRDGVTLFRGQLHLKGGQGSAPLEVLSANGRTRVEQGSALLSFDESRDETQVLAFRRPLRFENRFQAQSFVDVKPGETSSIDFKVVRVTPAQPSAVSLASVKKRLSDLDLDEQELELSLSDVRHRQDRRFASVLRESPLLGDEAKQQQQANSPGSERGPASPDGIRPNKLVPEEMFETISTQDVTIAPKSEQVSLEEEIKGAPLGAKEEREPAGAGHSGKTASTTGSSPDGLVKASSSKTAEELAEEKARALSEEVARRFDATAYSRHTETPDQKREVAETLLRKQTAQRLNAHESPGEALVSPHPEMAPNEILFPDRFTTANQDSSGGDAQKKAESLRMPAAGSGGSPSLPRSKGIEIEDVEGIKPKRLNSGRKRSETEEDRERKRLMQELSRVNSMEE